MPFHCCDIVSLQIQSLYHVFSIVKFENGNICRSVLTKSNGIRSQNADSRTSPQSQVSPPILTVRKSRRILVVGTGSVLLEDDVSRYVNGLHMPIVIFLDHNSYQLPTLTNTTSICFRFVLCFYCYRLMHTCMHYNLHLTRKMKIVRFIVTRWRRNSTVRIQNWVYEFFLKVR